MGTRIVTEDLMVGGRGGHTAHRVDRWVVSWLPDRVLDLTAAITAMVLGDIYAENPPSDSPRWRHARDYERELEIGTSYRPPRRGRACGKGAGDV
jgi:hypothetical protein